MKKTVCMVLAMLAGFCFSADLFANEKDHQKKTMKMKSLFGLTIMCPKEIMQLWLLRQKKL